MGLYIDQKYGPQTAEKLLIKSRGTYKPMPFELEAKIAYYREQVEKLKKMKSI